jgi:ribosomal protein S18 acetylase RimI-like enzyme
VDIIKINEIGADLALGTAKLVYMAMPYFYDLLPLSKDALLDAIVEDFNLSVSETSTGCVVVIEDNVVAIQCSYPSNEMKQRQAASMMGFMRKVTKANLASYQRDLANYTKQVSPVPNGIQGYYLSRFTVHSNFRGKGLADKVLELFMGFSSDLYLLHVSRDNHSAIKFYQRHEFKIYPGPAHYNIMIKKATRDSRL